MLPHDEPRERWEGKRDAVSTKCTELLIVAGKKREVRMPHLLFAQRDNFIEQC
jgi:hypothetical protein